MSSFLTSKDKDEQKDDDDEERNKKEDALLWDLIDEMVHSLGRAWPEAKETQGIYLSSVIFKVFCNPANTYCVGSPYYHYYS